MSNVHSNGENGVSTAGPAYNLIRFHQDNRICDLNARLTDRAFEAGGEVLGLVIAARAGVQVRRSRQSPSSGIVIDNPQLVLPGVDTENGSDGNQEYVAAAEAQARQAIPAGADAETLRQIFRYNDDKLKLINTQVKATKQEDFIRRLSVLFLYAHKLEGRELVPRASLNDVLKDVKLYDNWRSWITKSNDLVREKDNVGLSIPGRDYAVQVLKEFRDPNIQTTWTLDSSRSSSRSAKAGTKAGRGSEESKSAKGRRARGTSYTAQITKLFGEGFFTKKRTAQAVQSELENRKYKFPLKRINEALAAMTRAEKLYSTKNEAGEWVFQNKQAK